MNPIQEQQVNLIYLAYTMKLKQEVATALKEVAQLSKRVKKLQKKLKVK